MAKFQFIITGVPKLTKMLNGLGSTRARALHQKAMRKAARPVLTDAKSNTPVKTGALRDSLTIKAKRKTRDGSVGVLVVNKTGHHFKGKTFYGGFQEFGWKVGHRRRGDDRKQIPGKHFMENSGNSQEEAAISIYQSELERLIQTEAKK